MRRALVVDDSRTVRLVLTKMLIRNGFTVVSASNGMEALQHLNEDAKDVVLVCADYNMPEMNGIEMLRSIRALPAFESLPVLMITTETQEQAMEKAFAAGASEYVMKPFTEEAVTDKLRILGLLS